MTRKHWIDTGLGLGLSALILVGIELALGLSGVQPPPETDNRSRGFDSAARYLVPLEDTPGAWQTVFRHRTRPEVTIPPKSHRVRVITFGGSNVHGFPARYLKNLLNRQAQGGGVDADLFEVVNLGRPGYGSERVRIIFEQALEVLEPDVVILYTGHNEFVERGFQMDLEEPTGEHWTDGPRELARGTRVYQALATHFEERNRSQQAPRHAEPEAWENEYAKFKDITYDETEAYFQALKANVASMCAAAREQGVRMILSTVVYNRFSVPHSSTYSEGVSQADRETFEARRQKALANLPAYLDLLLPTREEQRLHGFDFEVRRPDRTKAPVGLPREDYVGWRDATGILANRDPRMRPEECWSEAVKPFYTALKLFQEGHLGNKRPEQIEEAAHLLEGALFTVDDHPRALFELALIHSLKGDSPAKVRHLLETAAARDRAPRKGSAATNRRIQEVAREHPEVVFLDMDRKLQNCVPGGLFGWEWMADHCHPFRGTRDAMMELFCETLLDAWPDIAAEAVAPGPR